MNEIWIAEDQPESGHKQFDTEPVSKLDDTAKAAADLLSLHGPKVFG